jgi:glycosyltransferase involved in cell wall biosynthesis
VIYPGSLSRHQGIDVLLRAFRFFTDRVAGAELFVYGDGPAGDDLRKLSSDLGIGHMVTFLSSLPIDQMPAVMAAAAVGVEPKGGDGFSDEALGTKILEFMACGLPVIAARTTVNQRYFNDRVLRFFPPGNAEALADALVETHAKWASHEVSSCDASDFAMRYSWQEHEADYHNLLKPQSKPAPDRDSRISAQ